MSLLKFGVKIRGLTELNVTFSATRPRKVVTPSWIRILLMSTSFCWQKYLGWCHSWNSPWSGTHEEWICHNKHIINCRYRSVWNQPTSLNWTELRRREDFKRKVSYIPLQWNLYKLGIKLPPPPLLKLRGQFSRFHVGLSLLRFFLRSSLLLLPRVGRRTTTSSLRKYSECSLFFWFSELDYNNLCYL